MNTELRAILSAPDVKAKLASLGADPMAMSPEEFKSFIARDTVKWTAAVKASGATVD